MKTNIINTFAAIMILVVANFLTGCGDVSQLDPTREQTDQAPDFSRWDKAVDANDQCFRVDREKVHCQTEFPGQEENCGNALFKFVSIKGGYMYVQTLENVFIRQGEYMIVEFDSEPVIYKIKDSYAEEYYHVFKCIGSGAKK